MFYNKEKIIFIHIPKTAGSSIGSQLFLKSGAQGNGSLWSGLSKKNKIEHYGNRYVKLRYPPHAKASELKELYPEIFKEYTKVSVVRDPYDRFCSAYYWGTSIIKELKNKDPELVMNKMIKRKEMMVDTQESFLYEKDNLIVDKIFKYEDLNSAFEYLQIKPVVKKPSKRITVDEFYDKYPHMKNIIKDYFSIDFERFDYAK